MRVERQFGRAVRAISESGGGRVYRDVAALMIRMLADIVWIEDASNVSYLAPLLRPLSQQERFVVASLNYDNSVELVAGVASQSCDTGITSWSESGEFCFDSPGLKLMKLHGSIDWALQSAQRTTDRPMPHAVIQGVEPASVKKLQHRPAVVFGQRNKLTAEGPFLDLLMAFRKELDAAERLTIVGYSFRDAHINEYISQWLNGSPSRLIRVVDPKFGGGQVGYARDLKAFCGARLEVVEEPAEVALERLFPSSM